MQTKIDHIELRNEKGGIWRISRRMWRSIRKETVGKGWTGYSPLPPLDWDETKQGAWPEQYEEPQGQIVTKLDSRRLLGCLLKIIGELIGTREPYEKIEIEGLANEDIIPYFGNFIDFLKEGQFTINRGDPE